MQMLPKSSRSSMDRKFGPPLQAGIFLLEGTGLARPWTARAKRR